jgi:hypothetical protein
MRLVLFGPRDFFAGLARPEFFSGHSVMKETIKLTSGEEEMPS